MELCGMSEVLSELGGYICGKLKELKHFYCSGTSENFTLFIILFGYWGTT